MKQTIEKIKERVLDMMGEAARDRTYVRNGAVAPRP